ncbi:esterase-like activity of phytase family protein [Leptolyngbya sp. CCY15150]|uniref:esterase-like activity of phytase family protein n=1 Tax=Leptolyngbya sp. CCY15150 TaxID=2767772 RepID=UPI001EF1CAA6|nr:esterase-like activity of phytase family protein [Leptolyngbya sp. CCY15150]
MNPQHWQAGQRLTQAFMAVVLAIALGLTSCAIPQVQAEDRLFLPLAVDILGHYQLPATVVDDTPVGGLSGITYDRQRDRFYAISDDRSILAPARFYTLKMAIGTDGEGTPTLDQVTVENVTLLHNREGELFAANTIDPEGIALSPRSSVFISSEGSDRQAIPPSVQEFDLETGEWLSQLPIPDRYLPQDVDDQPQGVRDNLGFEALTINPGGYSTAWLEPFRLFVATESALHQDLQPSQTTSELERLLNDDPDSTQSRNRFLHYLVGDGQSTLIAEHLYLLDTDPPNTVIHGLVELITLDQAGHFLSLERTLGLAGFGATLFQLATGSATDISGLESLSASVDGIEAIRKQPLFDLTTLDLTLDNLEGMTLGPRLPDGSQSLILISDDNFDEAQVTQILVLRLRQA